MVFTKRLYKNLSSGIIFSFLALFPFGQLLRLQLNLFGKNIFIPFIDFLALASLPYLFSRVSKKPKVLKFFSNSLVIVAFSTVVSLAYFRVSEVLIGSLYILRLFSYVAFFVLVWNLVVEKVLNKHTLFNCLILVSFFTAIFGWIQYFWIPDLTTLKYLGWDDHLGRLAGTFLDPGFTGIILVFGFLLSAVMFINISSKKYFLLSIFFILSTMFTYSRASYLALVAGSMFITIRTQRWKYGLALLFIFLSAVAFLPRPKSEGVRLERSSSAVSRLKNYRETLEIIREYPLFGVGYNNLCWARVEEFGGNTGSHACGGSDSSLLFVLATTGVIGVIGFLNLGYKILTGIGSSMYSLAFLSVAFSLLIHSLFNNSLFYPWVMGFVAMHLAISLKE